MRAQQGRQHDLDAQARAQVVREHRAAEIASPDVDDLKPSVDLAGRLAGLAERAPDHPLLVATRLALEIAEGRREYKREMREASHSMSHYLADGEDAADARARAAAVEVGMGRWLADVDYVGGVDDHAAAWVDDEDADVDG